MQGHQYVALRRLPCQDGNKMIFVEPGETVPTRISDLWPAPAVRAMVNTGHIQFAKIKDTGTLPYLEAKGLKAAQRKIVDEQLPPPTPKSKGKWKKKVKVKAA